MINDMKIDRKFFKIKVRTNRPKGLTHLAWRDERKLSFKQEKDRDKSICDQIVKMAEMEVGVR